MNLGYFGIQIFVSLIISFALLFLVKFLRGLLKKSSFKYLNPSVYLPEEEVQTLKQVHFLIIVLLLFILIMNFFFDNNIILSNSPEFYALHSILDIIVSVYVASIIFDEKSFKNIILLIFLIPIGSICFLLFGESFIEYWNFLRIPAFLYLFKYFYDKFKEYTDENRLNFSIILLFLIVFISINITMFIENEDPLNAIVMVSNAFTSNGYAILGDTTGGKINSIILVWSGYILSGVATATLTVAISIRRNKGKFKAYEKRLNELQSSIDELKSYNEKLDGLQSSIDELKSYNEKLDRLQSSIDELKNYKKN